MRLLDLFSGIGGFSLGLERAGFQTVAFCEVAPYPRAVLAHRWPKVPCYDDVRTLSAERLAADGIAVDAICGGFPCQGISAAGRGAGLADPRSSLWSEYARIVRQVRPAWVIVENSPNLRTRGGDQVIGDLEACGYACWPLVVGAAHAGASHKRGRVFVVANTASEQHEASPPEISRARAAILPLETIRPQWAAEPPVDRVAYGVPNRLDRIAALGNAVVPQVAEAIGRAILQSLST